MAKGYCCLPLKANKYSLSENKENRGFSDSIMWGPVHFDMRIIQWVFNNKRRELLIDHAKKSGDPIISCYSVGNIFILLYSDKLKRKWIESSKIGYYGFRKDGLLLVGLLQQNGEVCRYSAISFFDFYLLLTLFLSSILFSLPNILAGLNWGFLIASIASIINRLNNADEELLRKTKDYLTDC